jgi:hypothetical protein
LKSSKGSFQSGDNLIIPFAPLNPAFNGVFGALMSIVVTVAIWLHDSTKSQYNPSPVASDDPATVQFWNKMLLYSFLNLDLAHKVTKKKSFYKKFRVPNYENTLYVTQAKK